ncbi:ABC transporter permease [Acuticoccus mangrovi]|uniref:ABC transporter permease n=1 Tax=Acuticoccus mangrovi TaxID=2796142 RepID=A0A934MJ99_9HYPH|nr:ABC transporter permease [Acuticoccus mangrovi]MBJ3774359.1 ABC transporter permease [Acuticoccus mangrovi]
MRVASLIGGGLVCLVVLVAVFASQIAPGDPAAMVARPMLPLFSPGHLFGTDQFGRDVLAGVVHGARISLLVGVAAALATLGLGTAVGLAAGFLGGFADAVAMRVTEAFQTVPTFLLALALCGVMGASLTTIVVAIAIASWPLSARLVRGEVLRLRTLEYVDAARMAGLRPLSIALTVVMPGALVPVAALFGVTVGEAILVESALSFLGLGDPNVFSWGAMVANGRTLMRTAPAVALLPGMAIAVTVLGISLLGDRFATRQRPS